MWLKNESCPMQDHMVPHLHVRKHSVYRGGGGLGGVEAGVGNENIIFPNIMIHPLATGILPMFVSP